MIQKLVNAICPDMPSDRQVKATNIMDRYFTIDMRERILYVPSNDAMRANLSLLDSFSESVKAFERMTDEDFSSFKYKWDFFETNPENHQLETDPVYIGTRLNNIKVGIEEGIYTPYVSVDIETRKVHWEDNKILLVGLAYEDYFGNEYSLSFPFDAAPKDILQEFFDNPKAKFIWQNGKFDKGRMKYLGNINVRVDEDTMLMHYVGINERRGTHGLKDLGCLYLQAPKWDDQLDKYKKDWCREHRVKLSDFTYDLIPTGVLVPYLHMDCISTLRLFHVFEKIMRPESKDIYRWLIKASNVYSRVELNGAYLDVNYLGELREVLTERIDEANAIIERTSQQLWNPIAYVRDSGARSIPKAFNMKSPKQLKWMLEQIMKRPVEGTGKEYLEELAAEVEHAEDSVGKEFIQAITSLRKSNKYLDTYVTGLQETLCRDLRIRSTYNLHGTETGRLSCSDPNMQNIPRDAFIKNLFTAPEGKTLLQLDYSQAELRVLAYLSGDDWLTDVYVQKHDLHDRVAEQMFGPNFDKEQRVMAKTINFGIAYGRGAASIAKVFNLSMPEAQKLIDDWFVPMPDVKNYLNNQKRAPFKGIPINTVFGRQRSFIITNDNRHSISNEAMNMPIQSTASDCTMISLCTIQDWIDENDLNEKVKIIITVHDSIVLEVDDDKELVDRVAEACTTIMREVPARYLPDCCVPFVADAEVGPSWGNLEKWGK